MKITAMDRIQGLRRIKEYRADYREYASAQESQTDSIVGALDPCIQISEKGRSLCLKWDLQFPVNPFDNAAVPAEWYFPLVRHPRKNELAMISRKVGAKGSPDDEIVTHLNHRLVLSIDPSFPIDTIMKSIETLLPRLGVRKSTEKSDRPHSYDIWEVYDLYEELSTERRTYAAVAWAIDSQWAKQEDVAPRIDDADIKGVERAYKKACKIINHIKNSVKK